MNAASTELRRGEAVAWGTRPDAPIERPRLRLVGWKPLTKNSLRGFATIELPNGLRIRDVPVLVGRNGAWASLPSKPLVDGDGQQKRDANGKPAYVPILEWRDRDLSSRFSVAVIELVRAAHPEALVGTGGAP